MPNWELVTEDGRTQRMRAAAGWIVKDKDAAALTYVPDSNSKWKFPAITPPVPTVTPAPAPLVSKLLLPDLLENLVLTADKVYETPPSWLPTVAGQSSKAVMHFDLKQLADYGKTVTAFVRRKSKHPTTTQVVAGKRNNVKIMRIWHDLFGVKYPNAYYGVPDWTVANPDWMFYVELFNPWNTKQNHFSALPWPCGDEKWRDESFTIVYPSALGAADGRLKFECDGKVMLDTGTFQMNGGPATGGDGKPLFGTGIMTGLFDRICLQTIFDEVALPAGSYVQFAEPLITVS
jgi:hypothetical protein